MEKQASIDKYITELSTHPVLSLHWDKISLILKGSVARGYCDKYSDLDFVLFTDTDTFKKVIDGYIKAGLSNRTDGIFLPLGNWEGHYNLETYDTLKRYFNNLNIFQIWEYYNVNILHDCNDTYKNIIKSGYEKFRNNIDNAIKKEYLNIQLQLDWLRHPLKRADQGATIMYASSFMQGCCRLIYLLEGKPYPCDKWLFYYIKDSEFKKLTDAYIECFEGITEISKDLELEEYPLYYKGDNMVSYLIDLLHKKYGNASWIDEWYLYA